MNGSSTFLNKESPNSNNCRRKRDIYLIKNRLIPTIVKEKETFTYYLQLSGFDNLIGFRYLTEPFIYFLFKKLSEWLN